jgi:hypothetical protein
VARPTASPATIGSTPESNSAIQMRDQVVGDREGEQGDA